MASKYEKRIEEIFGNNHWFEVNDCGGSHCWKCGDEASVPQWPPNCNNKVIKRVIIQLLRDFSEELIGEIEEVEQPISPPDVERFYLEHGKNELRQELRAKRDKLLDKK